MPDQVGHDGVGAGNDSKGIKKIPGGNPGSFYELSHGVQHPTGKDITATHSA